MKIMYETSRIILTPFTREITNNSDYESWFYDPDVTKYNHWGLFPHSKKKEETFLDMCESGEGDLVLSIMIKEEITIPNKYKPGLYEWHNKIKHIGNLSLQSINKVYRSAEYAITIGDKNYWNQRIGFEASLLLFHHGFDKLNLHRIWTGTAVTNKEMRKLAVKLEMTQEAIFTDGMFLDGGYVNIITFAILENRWRSELCQKAKQIMI